MKVLFICSGNVARSQMAEAFYNKFSESTNAISAGILPHTPDRYKHPVQEVIDVMAEEGIDVSANKVKTVTPEMVFTADSVIVLCDKKELPQFVLDHPQITYWDINDPFNTSIENFRSIRNEIKERVKRL